VNAANPVSPKVVAGLIAGAVVPIVLSVLASILNWLVTGDGQSWLDGLLVGTPPWLPVVVLALVSSLSAAVAGYLKTDPLRIHIPLAPYDSSHPAAPVFVDQADFGPVDTWTPGVDEEPAG
jgi:hypothetical protein